MSQSRLAWLFKVYFEETATAEERDELMQLMMLRENDAEVQSLISETWQNFKAPGQQFTKEQSEDMLANILATGKPLHPLSITTKITFLFPDVSLLRPLF
ncbi:hypothetical protein BH11BAC5_BH11BAC5_11080 [soil metagenome]